MSKARDLARVRPDATFQPGTIAYFAMSSPPAGWLKCDGSAVSRTTYADLFAAIGETYGAGDGSATFQLPDLRGEFVRGWDDGRGVDSGRALGSAQAEDIGPHDHALDMRDAGGSGTSTDKASATYSGSAVRDNQTGAVRAHGSGIGAETRPRNVSLLACIKT